MSTRPSAGKAGQHETARLVEAKKRAMALHQAGNLPAAAQLYSAILNERPDEPEVLHYLGVLQAQCGHLEDAHRLISRALRAEPRLAEGHSNLGNVLLELKRYEEALASYDRALSLKPDDAGTYNSRGVAFQEMRRHAEALASYDRALSLKPEDANVHNNRGNALLDLKRHKDALASYDRALALQPDYVDALNNRGNLLIDLKRHAEALASFDQAIAVEPDRADSYNNRGNGLQILKRHEEAVRDFSRALDLDPDYDYAAGALIYSKMHCCDWRGFNEASERVIAGVRAGKKSAEPFAFLAISDSTQDQLACARTWISDKFPAEPSPLWRGERYAHDRIRLAYLSYDFREHSTAYLIAELIEMHDRARFHTTALSFGPDDGSETRSRLKRAFDQFIDVRVKSDLEIASLLRTLEIDIAVDLGGFTTNNRTGVFAYRPAPIQVNYLGYPGTMGADYIDYVLADRIVIPEESRDCYAESVAWLPDTYQVNDSKRPVAMRIPSRADLGLPENGFVFCCFNNNFKITPKIFDVWMRLLEHVDGSVLWLLEDNAAVAKNLRQTAAITGVAPGRIVFARRTGLEEYRARYSRADLFLDTLPYNAHTTASDALWAGLPVVTCLGTTFAGRVAGSLLNAAGLGELVTYSLKEYESLALELATGAGRLAAVREKLAENRNACPLFDTNQARRHIEAAYVTMWERVQQAKSAASFAIDRNS